MAKIAIIGAGGFGMALSQNLCKTNEITLYTPFLEEYENLIKLRGNPKLLPDIILDNSVILSNDSENLKDQDIVIIAVPSQAVRSVSRTLKEVIDAHTIVACVSKGVENKSLLLVNEIIESEIENEVVVVSGPSHAEEVARGVVTTLVAAGSDENAVKTVQQAMTTESIRMYSNNDIVGVEIGGAAKNVIALAAGILDGMNQGDNTKAALMTRGIVEIARLGKALGARRETFSGLSGIGDLIVTCTSVHSRNRQTGVYIGEGMSVKEAIARVGMTVEGYTAARNIYLLAEQNGVSMPIVEQVYEILYNDKKVGEAMLALMDRGLKDESSYVFWDN